MFVGFGLKQLIFWLLLFGEVVLMLIKGKARKLHPNVIRNIFFAVIVFKNNNLQRFGSLLYSVLTSENKEKIFYQI